MPRPQAMRPYFGGQGRPLADVVHAIAAFHGRSAAADGTMDRWSETLSENVGRPVLLMQGTAASVIPTLEGQANDPTGDARRALVVLRLPSGRYDWLRAHTAGRRTRPSRGEVRRLARRGGVKRFRGDVYGETVGLLRGWLRQLLGHCVALTELQRRRCVTTAIVMEAMRHTNHGGATRLYR